jgi:dihydropyrimidinase
MSVGADADIVVWDPEGTRHISAETHHQNIDFNIYEGMNVTGIPVVTLSRGSVVWQDGQLHTVRGAGKNIKRAPFPSYWDAIKRKNALSIPIPVHRTPKEASK